jgi:hypothetical protein
MRNAVMIALAFLVSLPLAAEQMNVKELTGLNDFELVRAMQEMSAGLGVNCGFCHARKGEELDFASDEKREKKTAREMIALTKAANASTFNGRATISCYTCHRGKESPVGIVPLPVEPPAAEEKEAERPKMPSAEEIVKKYAEAAGDTARWASIHAKGTRESADGKQSLPFELQASHGKYHVVSESPRGKMEQSVAGEEGWMKGGPEPRPMNASDLARFRYQANAFEPVDPKEISTDPKGSRVIRKEKIGDHEAYVLFTGLGPKSRQRLYFDATTGLLLRRVILTDSPVGTIPSQTDYEDWKEAGGTKYPHIVKWTSPDTRSAATRKYSEVNTGAKIDEKVFEK